MAPASRDEPDVPAEDARDDCRTNQPSPPGSGEGSVEEDTLARDAETTPDQATDAKPDEDDEARQVRGSARASRHDPFPEASRARLLLSFRDFQCRFFPGAVRFVEGARGASRRRASGNAARRGSTTALARTRRDLRGPSRRFARTSARSMPVRAKTPNACAPSFFALDSREPVGDWSERDRGEIFSPRFFLFHSVPFPIRPVRVFETAFFFSPRRTCEKTKKSNLASSFARPPFVSQKKKPRLRLDREALARVSSDERWSREVRDRVEAYRRDVRAGVNPFHGAFPLWRNEQFVAATT